MHWLILAQAAAQQGEPNSLLSTLRDFGMAGAVIFVVIAFLTYQERQAVRQEKLDEKRYETVNGLRAEIATLSGSINRLDSHISRLQS